VATIIHQTPERVFNPNQPLSGNVDFQLTGFRILELVVTVPQSGPGQWPDGDVCRINVTRPDGSSGGGATFSGGVALDRLGNVATIRSAAWGMPNDAELALGLWNFEVTMFANVRSAVTLQVT
jgi:hypothetical protein